jgi:hypothetical protein
MTNDCGSDREVSFYSYNKSENEFELLKIATVDKGEIKTICIDNESEVTEGLYIKTIDRTKMVKLGLATGFNLNLCDNSFEIEKSKGPR